MSFALRPYQPKDLEAVYDICLKTGDSGENAAHLYENPKALGHLYAGPYVTLEPESAFMLEDGAGVCGYILGAFDTKTFYEALLSEWLPRLQQDLPDPTGDPEGWSRTESLYHTIHYPLEAGYATFYPALHPYPSHLHIDLLPRAQGQGQGARLMQGLFEALRERGSPAVHLGMSSSNTRAKRFYKKLGFTELLRVGSGDPHALYLGRQL